MGQKCSDLDTIPLNAQYHREQHRIGLRRFQQTYDLDIAGLLVRLTTKPRVTIWQGRYIGRWSDQTFVLGYLEQGFRHSFMLLKDRCRELLAEEIRSRAVRFFQRTPC